MVDYDAVNQILSPQSCSTGPSKAVSASNIVQTQVNLRRDVNTPNSPYLLVFLLFTYLLDELPRLSFLETKIEKEGIRTPSILASTTAARFMIITGRRVMSMANILIVSHKESLTPAWTGSDNWSTPRIGRPSARGECIVGTNIRQTTQIKDAMRTVKDVGYPDIASQTFREVICDDLAVLEWEAKGVDEIHDGAAGGCRGRDEVRTVFGNGANGSSGKDVAFAAGATDSAHR